MVVLILFLLLNTTNVKATNSPVITDVSTESPFYSSIRFAVYNNILLLDKGRYYPDAEVTHKEFLEGLLSLLSTEQEKVELRRSFSGLLTAAIRKGAINNINDLSQGELTQPITRTEASKYLSNVLGKTTIRNRRPFYSRTVGVSTKDLTPSLTNAQKEDLIMVLGVGIYQVDDQNNVYPNRTLTKNETALFINRLRIVLENNQKSQGKVRVTSFSNNNFSRP